MAGLGGRMSTVIKAKVSKILDKAEDPAETLDYSYQKQLEALQNVKKGIADVVTSKKRLQMQSTKLEQQVVKLDTQARQALAQNNEDLARVALERKNGLQSELQTLDAQVTELEAQQERLTESEKKLRTKVEAFRTKKEVIKAQYSAAEAQVRISEAATGVGEEMADVGLAMQRAEDKVETMKARADAVSELEAAGTFEDLTALGVRRGRHRQAAPRALDHQRRRRRAGEDEGRARDRRSARPGRAPGGRGGCRNRRRGRDRGRPRMIVRISGEGQWTLDDDVLTRLNELDNAAVAAVEAGDEPGFHAKFDALLAMVRADGVRLPADDLHPSDVILPPADASFAEAGQPFTGEGLIPD